MHVLITNTNDFLFEYAHIEAAADEGGAYISFSTLSSGIQGITDAASV